MRFGDIRLRSATSAVGHLDEHAFRRAIRQIWPYYLAMAHSWLPVVLWRGAASPSGRQASMLVAGKSPWVDHIPMRFFEGSIRREKICRSPVWRLPDRLRQLGRSADMTVVRVSRLTAPLFMEMGYLHAAEWIDAELVLPEDPKAPMPISRNLRGGDLRIIRRNRLEAAISHDLSDFDYFYHRMYVPFTRNRFGELGVVKSYRFFRACFRRGALIWVTREGQRLAAAILDQHDRRLILRSMATLHGDLSLVKLGTLAAVYQFCFAYARQQRCTVVGLGTSRALLQDGVLRYKRKWGAKFLEPSGSSFGLFLGWQRLQGVVADFLSHTSPIFKQPDGLAAMLALSAPTPVNSEDVLAARDAYWIKGLKRIYLVAPAGWEPGAAAPHGIVLVDARNPGKSPFPQTIHDRP
jgi:hypothetical protein